MGNYPDIKPLETQLGVIRQQLAQMKYEGKETTQEYQDLLGVAANMKDALADVEAGINAGASDTAQLDVLIKGTQIFAAMGTMVDTFKAVRGRK